MAKFCANCGAQVEAAAMFCHVCGFDLSKQQSYDNRKANPYWGAPPPYQQPYQQNRQTPPPNYTNPNSFFILQELSRKLKNVAIIWLITGILQIMLGASFWATDRYAYIGGIFMVVAGVGNILYACIHFGYSKHIMTNPASVLRTFDTPALYIVNLVYNILIGALLGIAGGIYALTIRSYVQSNMYVLQQNGYYNNSYGRPPQPPPYQNGTWHTPPNHPYTPPPSSEQNQQKQQGQPSQPNPTNSDEEKNKNEPDDFIKH